MLSKHRKPVLAFMLIAMIVTIGLGAMFLDANNDQATFHTMSDAQWQQQYGLNPAQREALRRMLETAEQRMPAILEQEHRIMATMAIATLQTQAGDLSRAWQTMTDIEDAYWRAMGIRWIAHMQAEAGHQRDAHHKLMQALETTAQIEDPEQRDRVIFRIAEMQIETGDFDGAGQTVAALKSIDHQLPIFRKIAMAKGKSGDLEGAKQAFAQALDAVSKIERPWSRIGVLRGIAREQSEAGDLEGAIRTAEIIGEIPDQAYKFPTIADAQVRAGNLAAAQLTAQKIEDLRQRVVVLLAVAKAHAAANDLEQAGQAYAVALETALLIKEESFRVRALFDIALSQAHAGDFKGAERSAMHIQDPSLRPHMTLTIVHGHLQRGEHAEAIQLAKGINDELTRARALTAAAAAQAKEGNLAQANDLLAMALDAASRVTPPELQSGVVGRVAQVQAQLGDFESAHEITKRILVTGWRIQALLDIAELQAKQGDLEGSRQTFRHALDDARAIENERERMRTIETIATTQAKAGDIEGVEAWATGLTDPVEQNEIFIAIGYGLLLRLMSQNESP